MRAAARGLLVVGAALWIAAPSSFGMGFGKASTSTVLGQPLDFSVVLRQEPDEFVDAECVSAEVTAGEERLPKEALRVAVEGPASGSQRTLRVTSTVPMLEPVVSVTLGVGCPARLSRNFTAFVDPPTIQLAQQEAAEPPAPSPPAAATPPTPTPPPPSPAATAAPRAPAATAPAAPRRQAQRRTARPPSAAVRPAVPPTTTTAAAPRPPRAVTQRTRPAAPPPAGPRLQLEAAASPARIAAEQAERAASAAAAATQAAVAAAEAASQASASEAGRIRALEETLARLKGETQSTSDSLAALRARVQQAEAERFANPLVYALAALTALLAIALLLLLWKRSRAQEAQWWSDASASRVPDAATPSRHGDDSEPDGTLEPAQPLVVGAPTPPRVQPSISPETRPAVAEPRRPVSVEELIDLEQQAEFFVVLGQDEAAIDLLMDHLRGTGGISPLPYLKLLEIYRRRGEREPYERIRERFNRRFNAYAPEWDADLSKSRALEDYPHVMQRLRGAVAEPAAGDG